MLLKYNCNIIQNFNSFKSTVTSSRRKYGSDKKEKKIIKFQLYLLHQRRFPTISSIWVVPHPCTQCPQWDTQCLHVDRPTWCHCLWEDHLHQVFIVWLYEEKQSWCSGAFPGFGCDFRTRREWWRLVSPLQVIWSLSSRFKLYYASFQRSALHMSVSP